MYLIRCFYRRTVHLLTLWFCMGVHKVEIVVVGAASIAEVKLADVVANSSSSIFRTESLYNSPFVIFNNAQ